jgi:superfamily II DNA or RNA helicase
MIQAGFDFERSPDSGLMVPDSGAIVVASDGQALRKYQAEAVAGVLKQLEEFRSTIVVMPTGSGKTRCAAELIRHWPGRAMMIAHRDELLVQARTRLASETGELVGLEQAQFFAGDERIVVGSVQTLCMPARLERWQSDDFGLIIVDEAHHACSVSYRRVIDHFSGAKIVGITATPDRADEKAMGQVFESVAYVYEIEDAINDGWLCPIRVRQVFIGEINLSSCRTTAGDLNQGDLNAAMAVEEALHGVVKATIEQAGDSKTLVFTTSVENAKRLAEIFNRYKPDSARSVDGGTQIDDRRGILAAYKRGEFQYLTNCAIATEGFDEPEIACVAMARPTKSRSLFAQMVGRGLRIHPSKPDGALILEFTGNSGKHHLASSVDILGGRYEEDEVDAAQEIVKKNPGMRADDALAQAHTEAVEKAKRAEAAKRAQLQAQVQYTTRDFNPFDVFHMKRTQEDEWGERFGGKIASEKQIAALQKFKIDVPKDCTSQQASRLLGTCIVRMKKGLASYGQIKVLTKFGVPALNVSFKHASDLIEAVKRNGWKRPSDDVVTGIVGRSREVGED